MYIKIKKKKNQITDRNSIFSLLFGDGTLRAIFCSLFIYFFETISFLKMEKTKKSIYSFDMLNKPNIFFFFFLLLII